VTEAEWLACTEPQTMLEFLRGKASDRKLRLFAVACCRRAWGSLKDERCRAAVEVAESYADGLTTEAALGSARAAASGVAWGEEGRNAAVFAASEDASVAAGVTLYYLACDAANKDSRHVTADAARAAARMLLAPLLRDIFNPFHPVSLSLACLMPQVVALAQAAYDERELPAGHLDPARLAVLADALEDAGCTQADILNHLRGPGPHVRGCWAVDLLLGKA
jgi:hypothetical protein